MSGIDRMTKEQIMKLKQMKSVEEVKVYFKEQEVEVSKEELEKVEKYFTNGKMELGDSELEMVAGGGEKEEDFKQQAKTDGRNIPVPVSNDFCSCLFEQVWARSRDSMEIVEGSSKTHPEYVHRYSDVKCYSCSRQTDKYILICDVSPDQIPLLD